MATTSVAFAVDETDRRRLDRLVEKYGGDRSAFLRAAMSFMESADRIDRLRQLQAYGAERSAVRARGLDEVCEVVRQVLERRRPSS